MFRRRLDNLIALGASMLFAACTGDGDAPVDSQSPVAPAPIEEEQVEAPPGLSLLPGEFEFRGEHAGREVRLGFVFDAENMTRLVDGQPTAHETYSVVEDGPARVVIDLVDAEGAVKRREFVFSGPEVLADVAVPEVEYARVPVDVDGSGSVPAPD